MQVLQAGRQKLILLEIDADFVGNLATQAGFEYTVNEAKRTWNLELTASDRRAPLLLFDAADPGNLGWFSRCQFYVDGRTGAVLQTPITIANVVDRSGHLLPHSLKVRISKELPVGYRLPGRQPVTEHMLYAVLYNFLTALTNVGVGVCGGGIVKPLAGRGEGGGGRR